MKILIVEDDRVLADGLQRFLNQRGYETHVAVTGTEADFLVRNRNYDLVILDLELPGIDGITLLRRIRKYTPTLSILIVTARDSLKDRVQGLDLGADDYLIKPFELFELAARIRAVIRRTKAVDSGRMNCGNVILDIDARRASLKGKDLSLTKREWDMLEYLVLRSGKVVSKEQLISRMTDRDDEISMNAIEVHLHRLRAKLGTDAGITIHCIRGFGYYLERCESESN